MICWISSWLGSAFGGAAVMASEDVRRRAANAEMARTSMWDSLRGTGSTARPLLLKIAPRDEHALHIAGSLVDSTDFGVAVEFFNRVILCKTYPAKNLFCAGRYGFCDL